MLKVFSVLAVLLTSLLGLRFSSALASDAPRGRVLIILSAANAIPLVEGGTHATGIFLGELTEPAEAMLSAGYQLTFASPGGVAPTIDQDSLRLIYWGRSSQRLSHAKEVYSKLVSAGLNSPLSLEELAADETKLDPFDALFVPGGHGPLVDLYYKNMLKGKALNREMGKVLEFFHRKAKPTGLICHAPAALAAAPMIDGKWIYAGYKVTAISRTTEWFNEDFPATRVIDGHVGEYPSNILRQAGVDYVYTKIPMAPYVVEDRELMTGQDPFAAQLMGTRFVEKLNQYMDSRRPQ